MIKNIFTKEIASLIILAIVFVTVSFFAPLEEKLIGLKRAQGVEKRILKSNLFLSFIVLRLLVSVDILSYALGLFSKMPWEVSWCLLQSLRYDTAHKENVNICIGM